MAQNPVLTEAQCAPSGSKFTVRVGWQFIQGQSYFSAAVFDPSNTIVASQLVDGSRGTTVAMINGVTLAAGTSYNVRVAQCDSSGTLTSSYSQPLNVLQAPLTDIQTVNDLASLAVSASLPGVGSPSGISVDLLDSSDALVIAANIVGSSGVIIPPQPLDPAKTYYANLAPSSNQGLSTGGNQRVDIQMIRPAISAIAYDGNNMTVTTSTALPTGSTLTGTLFADDQPVQQKSGGAETVSFELAMATLDMSKLYSARLRAVAAGNSGPASPAVAAVVAPPRIESAYHVDGHVGATWSVPPVAPVPTGASLVALADGHIAGTPQTTLGYSGDIDISGTTLAASLKVQINSVFGVAKGPPASVDLPLVKPVIASVAATDRVASVEWTHGETAPGYRLYLNDSKGNPIAYADTSDLAGALTLPVNPKAAYTISVQPFGATAAGVAVSGPMSDLVSLLAAPPAVTTTSYDGTHVTVNWTHPDQTGGITGYQAQLLDAQTLRPTGASANAGAGDTSVQISVSLTDSSRVVAAVRATGTNTSGALGGAVAVIAVTPVITATDASATSVHIAWSAPESPTVSGYTVTISDDAPTPAIQTLSTSETAITVANTLQPAQVHVRVTATGPSATGPTAPAVNLFGDQPSFYPQPISNSDATPWLVRSTGNQPAAAPIVYAFPDMFTTTPSTLPSAGIFTLERNQASPVLPYKLTLPADSVAWKFDPASRTTLATDFLNFLKKMEMPNGTDVQIKPGGLAMVRQSLALGLPLLFSEQLKFMYGFDPNAQTGGFVDLVPGMRLRIDSELQQLTPPANNQMGYVPAGMSTYDIQSYAQGQALETGFNAFLSLLGRPTVPTPLRQPNAGGGGIIDLYSAAGRQPYFRLLYPSAMNDPKFTGLVDESSLPVILGAATYNGLLAASDQYVGQGNFAGLTGIYPFYFRGRATLTPEISASLNGRRRWLALGSTVADLIAPEGALPNCVSAAVGGFTMSRSIGGLSSDLLAQAISTRAVVTNRVRLEYPSATFSPTRPGYFSLPLFCGDDVRLSSAGAG
jgi:hypothetical protein